MGQPEGKGYRRRFKEIGDKITYLIEVLMALYVLIAICIQIVNVTKELWIYTTASAGVSFMELLSSILIIVVGIEFFALLCKPGVERVLEVIVFVLARHMIVSETSALEDLFVVVSIAIVVMLNVVIKKLKSEHKGTHVEDF